MNSKHLFTKNLAVHNHTTRSANHFHLPITNLTKYKKELNMQKLKFLITFPLTQSVQRLKYKFLNLSSRGFCFLTHFIPFRNILILIIDIHFRLCFNVTINILLCNHCITIVFCNLTDTLCHHIMNISTSLGCTG